MSSGSPNFPRIRPAVSSDKEAFIRVSRSGYELDAQWRWWYPGRFEFPEDTWVANGQLFDDTLAEKEAYFWVAELPSLENEQEWIVVAIATWEWKYWESFKAHTSELVL